MNRAIKILSLLAVSILVLGTFTDSSFAQTGQKSELQRIVEEAQKFQNRTQNESEPPINPDLDKKLSDLKSAWAPFNAQIDQWNARCGRLIRNSPEHLTNKEWCDSNQTRLNSIKKAFNELRQALIAGSPEAEKLLEELKKRFGSPTLQRGRTPQEPAPQPREATKTAKVTVKNDIVDDLEIYVDEEYVCEVEALEEETITVQAGQRKLKAKNGLGSMWVSETYFKPGVTKKWTIERERWTIEKEQ